VLFFVIGQAFTKMMCASHQWLIFGAVERALLSGSCGVWLLLLLE
jgi:hypothetical protein